MFPAPIDVRAECTCRMLTLLVPVRSSSFPPLQIYMYVPARLLGRRPARPPARVHTRLLAALAALQFK